VKSEEEEVNRGHSVVSSGHSALKSGKSIVIHLSSATFNFQPATFQPATRNPQPFNLQLSFLTTIDLFFIRHSSLVTRHSSFLFPDQ